jgi:hypothetical protein
MKIKFWKMMITKAFDSSYRKIIIQDKKEFINGVIKIKNVCKKI